MKPAALRLLFSAFLTLAPAAQAISTARGDLILGFKATSGMGEGACLEVNLGPASDYYNLAAGSAIVVDKLSVQDLVNVYGNDWNTRSDLFWGVAGTTVTSTVADAPPRTIWASRGESVPGTPSSPWPRAQAITLQNSSNTIGTMYTGSPGSMDRFSATANSASSVTVPAGDAGSWKAQEEIVTNASFRYFGTDLMMAINTFPAANSAYDGTAYTVLDIWDVRPGTGSSVLIGGLGINSAGKVVFSRDVTKFAPTSNPVELGQPVISYNANNTVTVTLADVPNGSYSLRRSTTLAAASWTTLFTQSPVSGTLTFTDPNPPQQRGFYIVSTGP